MNTHNNIGLGKTKKIKTKKGKISFFRDIFNNPFSYLLALPAIIYTFIFGYLTLPYMIIAFQKFSYKTGIFDSKWIGFENFEFFFKSNYAPTVIWNTVKLNFLFILAGTVVAVILSILLNEIKNKAYLKITQSTYLLPHFISWIIVSYILLSFFSTDYGIANKFLKLFNLEPINWYSTPGPWTWILVVMRVWKGVGINVVIFLAAITGIDNQLYEAAKIDGANRWQQNMKITLPLLMPTVAILTLLSIGKMFYGDFAMIYSIVRDNGLLYPTTDVIDTYIFRALRQTGNPSQAMAVGLFQAVMGFILVYGSNWITSKYFKEGALF